MKADCANCPSHACYTQNVNCTGISRETILAAYSDEERRIMKAAAYVERTFYSNITRLQETAELAHEAMCNPKFQARILAEKGTELFISCGLCVGHDTIFNSSCPGPVPPPW